jgi:hypothetical protein
MQNSFSPNTLSKEVATPEGRSRWNLPVGLDNDTCVAHILYAPHIEYGIFSWRGSSWEWIVTAG